MHLQALQFSSLREEWWWSNYCLKETFHLFKRKESKESLTTMKEMISVWFSLRSLALNTLPQHVALCQLLTISTNKLFNPEKPTGACFISKPLLWQKVLNNFGSMIHAPLSSTVFLGDDWGHISQRIQCLSHFLSEAALQQRVHEGRSDNLLCAASPATSRPLQHSHGSSRVVLLEQSTVLLRESRAEPVTKEHSELVPPLLLWCKRQLAPLPVLTWNRARASLHSLYELF